MRKLAAILLAICLGATASLTLSGRANAMPVTSFYAVHVNCVGSGQLCTPPFVQPFTVGFFTTSVQAEFIAAPSHCSAMVALVSLDGTLVFTSAPLAPGASTGVINLGALAYGAHVLTIQALGLPGGCNEGNVGSWGGTLKITTNKLLDLSLVPSHSARSYQP